MKSIVLGSLFGCCLLLSIGCGQKGDLYLPSEPADTRTEQKKDKPL